MMMMRLVMVTVDAILLDPIGFAQTSISLNDVKQFREAEV